MDGPFMGSYEKVNGVANHDTCKECLMSIYHVTQLPLLFLSKGQLISERDFGVLKSPEKRTFL